MTDQIITQHKHEKPCGPTEGRVDLDIGRVLKNFNTHRASVTFVATAAQRKALLATGSFVSGDPMKQGDTP
jgi:hypothetical protein